MTNLDRLIDRDPELAAGVAYLAAAAKGRYVLGGWKFGNFMDDEPAEQANAQPRRQTTQGSDQRRTDGR